MRDRSLRFWRRLRSRWNRAQLENELAEELEFHRSLKQHEYIERGLSADDAAAQARREMGNLTTAREDSRGVWSFLGVERFLQDSRFALRVLVNNAGFTAVAALSLALGIGGNAAVFSFVNALLFRPLPYDEPDRLVRINEVYPKAVMVLLQQQSRTMEVAAVSSGSEFNLIGQGEAVRLFGSAVSTNLFSVLGVRPHLRRTFAPGEDRPGSDAAVILSHALWVSQFGGDPHILGRRVALNGVDREVIGIMPPRFDYPSPTVQLWVTGRLDPANIADYWGGEFTPLIGRLKPGAALSAAEREVRELEPRIRNAFPFPMPLDWNAGTAVIPLQEDIVGGVRGKLLILLSSVGIVLLIACTNVASLLLSRGTVRRKEIALRAALGAGRGRILRQLLTESVLLSVIGGALGILLGPTALAVFRAVLPSDIPGLDGVAIDLHVLAFAAGLAVVTGIAFGIAPALSASQVELAESIKSGGQSSKTGGPTGPKSWLITAEIALTMVLVVAAGLLVKTLYRLTQVDPGFRAERILTIRITPNQALCEERSACIALYDDLLHRAREIPGVADAALANTIPLDGRLEISAIPFEIADHPKPADEPEPMIWSGAITPSYLAMMNIPVLAGRGFTEADSADSAGVALVASSTARDLWPGEQPVGKHIRVAWDREWRTVVGVVGDVRQDDLTGEWPEWVEGAIYLPYPQSVQLDRQLPAAMNLLVKATDDPQRIGGEIRNLAVSRNPNVPISEVRTMDSMVSGSIAERRSIMNLFVGFAAAALALAALGVYGLVSYSVSQRTYEIGVRMAIGASKGSILKMVLGQSLKIAVAGIAAGALGAIALTRFLSSLLFGVAATDSLTFLTVAALLFLTVTAASCGPAWRAAQVDLTKSLRVN